MHAKGALPGSNGSDSRANCASAGLILVMIGNGLQILLAPLTGNETAAKPVTTLPAARTSIEEAKEVV